jgi:hypothetical protein
LNGLREHRKQLTFCSSDAIVIDACGAQINGAAAAEAFPVDELLVTSRRLYFS